MSSDFFSQFLVWNSNHNLNSLHAHVMARTLSSDPNSIWILFGGINEGAKDFKTVQNYTHESKFLLYANPLLRMRIHVKIITLQSLALAITYICT